jgi:hypothetical protein
MVPTKTFDNVTPAIFACIKAKSIRVYATVYDPSEGHKGTTTTVTMGQKVVLGFDLDPENNTLTYSIIFKGFLVPEKSIWNGIRDNIAECME